MGIGCFVTSTPAKMKAAGHVHNTHEENAIGIRLVLVERCGHTVSTPSLAQTRASVRSGLCDWEGVAGQVRGGEGCTQTCLRDTRESLVEDTGGQVVQVQEDVVLARPCSIPSHHVTNV
jgi:hypothetical protein